MGRSRVELFEDIRSDRRREDLSIRALADKHRVHRRTVRQALASAVPPPRKPCPARARPAIDPWVELIDEWLLADKEVPRKQRHTARRIWQRLVEERGATLSEVTVSRHVKRRRFELGMDQVMVTVPQTHEPGAEAEVDFGEFYTWLGGEWTKLWMFVMRLSNSGPAPSAPNCGRVPGPTLRCHPRPTAVHRRAAGRTGQQDAGQHRRRSPVSAATPDPTRSRPDLDCDICYPEGHTLCRGGPYNGAAPMGGLTGRAVRRSGTGSAASTAACRTRSTISRNR